METSAQRDSNQHRAFRLPNITLFSLVVELFIVVAVALIITTPYMDFTPTLRVGGGEAEYLMASVFTASTAYRTMGYIPLWQPWLEKGEPLLNNPFAMLFNPIGAWPSFFIGPINGTKLSIILFLIFSGLGGWVLGRVLGLRAPARVLLGVLCMARGSLHGVLDPGFFPFMMSQAHFPWIFAGTISVLWFRQRRWPIALLAIMFVLMFWIGLLWYLPAIILGIALITLVHCVSILSRIGPNNRRTFQIAIDWVIIKRMTAAALLTVALSAIMLFPLITFRNNIGASGVLVDNVHTLDKIANLYFDGALKRGYGIPDSAYYCFVSPWWFVILLTVGVIAVSFMKKMKGAAAYPYMLRWVLAALAFLIGFDSLWGAGLNPIIQWAYEAIPLATSFRHAQRVFALSSFFISILIAVGLDYIWRRLRTGTWWTNLLPHVALLAERAQLWAAAGLVVLSGVAAGQVGSTWNIYSPALAPTNDRVDSCLAQLRSLHPDEPLSVWSKDYSEILSYLKYEIRHAHVQTDFYKPSPIEGTLYKEDISQAIPQFGQTWGDWDDTYLRGMGFQRPLEGMNDLPGFPCFYLVDNYYSYAFSVPVDVLRNTTLTPTATTSITSYKRNYDWVAVVANGSEKGDLAIVVQELAFPGWTAQVNGAPAKLEVVGGLIAVALPAGTTQYNILFQYKPMSFFLGADLTLLSILFCALYLLRVERLVPPEWRARLSAAARRWYVKTTQVMLDPNLVGTEEIPPANLFSFDPTGGPKLLPPPVLERVTPEAETPETPAAEILIEVPEEPEKLVKTDETEKTDEPEKPDETPPEAPDQGSPEAR
jgi:hypothetical protein